MKDSGRQPVDLSQRFKRIKSRNAAVHELEKLSSNVDLAEEGKNFWQTKAQKLELLLRGRIIMLAALVHKTGGLVVLDEETLRLMDSGDYTLSQRKNPDPDSHEITLEVKHEPKSHAAEEENETESGGARDSSDSQPADPTDPG